MSKPWPEKALRREIVQWLFDKMLAKWGKQFADKWLVTDRDDDPDFLLREWAKDLGGITELEFRRGVAKLNSLDRPPSLPEFLKACRPEVNAITAYYEAVEGSRSRERGEVGTWSHPAIFHASKRVSAFDLLNLSYSQVRERWETALKDELAKDSWDAIPEPPKRLAAPANFKSKEEAAKMMQQLLQKAAPPPTTEKVDHKRWARKILKRMEEGDKTLTPTIIEFAKHALRDELNRNGD